MSPRVLLIPCSCLAVAVAMGICTLSVQAERILYLDAAAPGLMPDTFWVDLSESQHDFMATGMESSRPIHVDNPGSSDDYYDFELDNGFVGVGDESLFDFETDVAGAGMGTPFSIHAYFKRTGFLGGGNTGENLVTKTEAGTQGQFKGWIFSGNGDNPSRVDMFMQVGNNTERLYHRIQDDAGHPSGFNDLNVMLSVTHDGSGTLEGTKQYVNGVLQATTWTADGLGTNPEGSTMRNDQPLKLGWVDAFGGDNVRTGTDSNMYFVEVHDTVLTEAEVVARWNNGDPERATVSPDRPSFGIDAIGQTDVSLITFQSVIGKTYELQYTIDTNAPAWTSVGLSMEGTGGTMNMADPDGFSAERSYRVYGY